MPPLLSAHRAGDSGSHVSQDILRLRKVATLDNLNSISSVQTLAEDIQRETLSPMLNAALFLLWSLVVAAFWVDEARVVGPLLVGLGCVAAYAILASNSRCPTDYRPAVLLLAVTGFILEGVARFDMALGRYALVLLPAIASAFWGLKGGYGVATGASVLVVLMGRGEPDLFSGVLGPLWLLWASTFVIARIYQGLHTAISWAWKSYEQAFDRTREAQERRATLLRMSIDLEQANYRLQRLNAQLKVAEQEADEARRIKAQFAANISHELRTPLNLIVGFGQMLLTAPEFYGNVSLSPPYRADIMTIYRNARHLLALVDDVLDLSQVEAGTMAVQADHASLNEIALEAIEATRNLFVRQGLTIESALAPNLPLVLCDRARIRQVFINLLANSSRYTEQGGVIVRTWAEEGWVRACVEDTGVGMSREVIERVFEPFFKQDASPTKTGGAGLGLAISKEFVELHGGRMSVESEEGVGTTFCFSLPVRAEGREVGLLRTQHQSAGTSARANQVVLVESDEGVLNLFRRRIEDYEMVPTTSLAEAASVCRRMQPAAVIVDVATSVQELVTWQSRLDVPVPVLGCPMPSRRHTVSDWGIRELLIKPIREQDIVRALGTERREAILLADAEPDMVRLLDRMITHTMRGPTHLTKAYTKGELYAFMHQSAHDMLIVEASLLQPTLEVELRTILALWPGLEIVLMTDGQILEGLSAPPSGHYTLLPARENTPLRTVRMLERLVSVFGP